MNDDVPYAKKRLGQHWLYDEASLEAMCEAAVVTHNDTVLEIGPGLGTLTSLLVGRAHQVIAVEFDERLARELSSRVAATNLTVVNQDILRFDLGTLPIDYKLVANIPYYLTSNLIRILSEATNRPQQAALLVQKEVAERVVAPPGAMSLLSVTAQYYWHVSTGMVIHAKLFTPPPRVDSQILRLQRRSKPLFTDVEPQLFFRLVKAGFGERRKTLRNSLSGGLHLDKPTIERLLQQAGLDKQLRAQNLALSQWHTLYQVCQHSKALP